MCQNMGRAVIGEEDSLFPLPTLFLHFRSPLPSSRSFPSQHLIYFLTSFSSQVPTSALFHPPRHHPQCRRRHRRRCRSCHLRHHRCRRLRRSLCCRFRLRRLRRHRRPAAAAAVAGKKRRRRIDAAALPARPERREGGGGHRSRRLNHEPAKVTPTTSCYQQLFNPIPDYATSPILSPPTPPNTVLCALTHAPQTQQPTISFGTSISTPNPRLRLFLFFTSVSLFQFIFSSSSSTQNSPILPLPFVYFVPSIPYLSVGTYHSSALFQQHCFPFLDIPPRLFFFPLPTSIFIPFFSLSFLISPTRSSDTAIFHRVPLFPSLLPSLI